MEYSMDRMPIRGEVQEAADAWIESDPAVILDRMPDSESVRELAANELFNIAVDHADDPRFNALLEVDTDVAIDALSEAIKDLF